MKERRDEEGTEGGKGIEGEVEEWEKVQRRDEVLNIVNKETESESLRVIENMICFYSSMSFREKLLQQTAAL